MSLSVDVIHLHDKEKLKMVLKLALDNDFYVKDIIKMFNQWKNMDVERLNKNMDIICVVQLKDNIPVGFFVCTNMFGKSELVYLLVDKPYKGQGFGKRLMVFYLEYCKEMDNNTSFVICHDKNVYSFFEMFGYVCNGIRKWDNVENGRNFIRLIK